VLATNVHPQRNPTAQQAQRLSDSDLLELVEPIYEHACWLAEMSVVDFEPFAELSRVIGELPLRRDAA
jgi:2-oxo-4-hydroxy-4-carboxy--5-ureidoimidazoline (OHCU) decarboxylase